MAQKTLIVVVGPTAIGKTDLAIQIAKKFKTEIISADSRQFFKEMEIGTAKPSIDELSEVRHHFINSHSINDFFSTGDFELAAIKTIENLFQTHNTVVMVGGSGLYVNAVCKGLDQVPEIDLNVREKLNAQFKNEGLARIQEQLLEFDPEYYNSVDTSNPQRMIRGLEVYFSTGEKLSGFLTNTSKRRNFNIIKIGLQMEREKLYERINHRVDKMMDDGLLEEVITLKSFRNLNALKTVGYSELFDYLDGTITLLSATDKIKQNTRRFAKRQITWFKRDEEINWFYPHQREEMIQFIVEKI